MTYVAIIVVVAIVMTKLQITQKLVQYALSAIGFFLLIMFVQHASQTIDFTLNKSNDLYPLILQMADDMFDKLFDFFHHIRDAK